jgi:glycosyltransferase involved in cell wall biosynthesis
MQTSSWLGLAGALAVPAYAYLGYPALLRGLGFRGAPRAAPRPHEWPLISITVPAYNEEAQIRGLIESLLRLDYPADRRQILIVSDASSDRTDEIVAEFADRGVELLRLPRRSGKGAAENAAAPLLRGEIIVNTDASIRIHPRALKPLIAQFADPQIGVASGRDISVGAGTENATEGESGYVGYEMWVRRLETDVYGIVGASGCLYAIRAHLHRVPLPDLLSRDFAAALIAQEHGYRSVSVDEAICYVPRATSLHREYSRKVRTMTHGLQTLFFFGHLLNPVRHGWFAWMLFSHKLCRWLVPWALAATVTIIAHATIQAGAGMGARWVSGGLLGLGLLAGIGWKLAETRPLPRVLGIPVFAVAANIAALHAWLRALTGYNRPIWEPTRRDVVKV